MSRPAVEPPAWAPHAVREDHAQSAFIQTKAFPGVVRAAFEEIRAPWSKRGHAIGLGLAIASGYATLGLVGFEGRADYTAIGGVVNIASRLCDKASDGQILLTQRAYLDIESRVQTKSLGIFELKGVKNAIEVYNVLGLSESAA